MEKKSDRWSDVETALFFKKNIENPCVNLIDVKNSREFYIKEAKQVIKSFTHIYAKSFLEEEIKKYSLEKI